MARLLSLILFFSFVYNSVIAQNTPDFVRIKTKSGRIAKTILPGNFVWLTLKNTYQIEGEIKDIRRDSIFLQQYQIATYYTPWYTKDYDTVSRYILAINYKDIRRIEYTKHKPGKRFLNLLGSFMHTGGAVYAGLNIVNGFTQGIPVFKGENLGRLGIAAGTFATGRIIKKRLNPSSPRKQKIEYVNMQ